MLQLPLGCIHLPQYGIVHGLQGNICIMEHRQESGIWSTSSSLSDLGDCSGFFLTLFSFFSFLTGYAVFCPFLNILSHRCHHHYWWAQLCPSVGPLELAGTSQFWHETSLGLSSHMSPLQSPTANTWTGTPNRPCLKRQMPGEKDKSALTNVQCGLHLQNKNYIFIILVKIRCPKGHILKYSLIDLKGLNIFYCKSLCDMFLTVHHQACIWELCGIQALWSEQIIIRNTEIMKYSQRHNKVPLHIGESIDKIYHLVHPKIE